jgi:hypothetical protein
MPDVRLRPAGDPEYFPIGVKHRYTRRPPLTVAHWCAPASVIKLGGGWRAIAGCAPKDQRGGEFGSPALKSAGPQNRHRLGTGRRGEQFDNRCGSSSDRQPAAPNRQPVNAAVLPLRCPSASTLVPR